MNLNTFLANLIYVLHIAFIVWFIITPFTQNEPMIVLHLMIAPLLMLHWILSDDSCCLWLAECKLRKLDHKEESFFYNLIAPFYKINDISDSTVKSGVWVFTLILWLVSLFKVFRDPGMLKRPFQQVFCKDQDKVLKVRREIFVRI